MDSETEPRKLFNSQRLNKTNTIFEFRICQTEAKLIKFCFRFENSDLSLKKSAL